MKGGAGGNQDRAPQGGGGGRGRGGSATSNSGEGSKYPLCIPCYCFFHTVQCGVKATSTSLCDEVPSSILLFHCRSVYSPILSGCQGRWGGRRRKRWRKSSFWGGDDEEDVEGVGREAQQGGEVHPSGCTDSSLAAAAPTLEVQHAIRHAVQVSQGRALPSNTTIIAPNPALLSPLPQASSSLPGPGPSGALTPGVRRAIAAACEKVKGGVVPLHCSPHHSKPAPVQLPSPLSQSPQCRSTQLPRLLQEQVWAKLSLSPLAPAEAPL